MANRIEVANMNTDRFVSALSRYRQSIVIYYIINDKKIISFTTYKKQVSAKPSDNDTYAIIPPGMEFRPDAVAKKAYGTTDLWWKIMEANNMKDIMEFKAGVTIRIPGNVF